jgi:hypothetical protein
MIATPADGATIGQGHGANRKVPAGMIITPGNGALIPLLRTT